MLAPTPNSILRPAPTDDQTQLTQRTVLRRPTPKRRLLQALQSKNAVKDIESLPELEESLHCICRGNFPLWQIVPATLRMASPAVIESLHVATLSFNDSNTADLLDLFDQGRILAVTMVVSVFFERQNPAQYGPMAEGLKARGQRIQALRSHAKIIAMALSDGRRFVVESSANLRSCRNIEQFAFTQSSELYAFHREWIDQVTAR